MSDEFTIISSANEEIKAQRTDVQIEKIPMLLHGSAFCFTNGQGLMHFQQLGLINLIIWFSHYLMKHPTEVRARIEQPILEAHITLKNRMAQSLGKSTNTLLEAGEFNITYTPHTENRAYFDKEGEYITFDIHPPLALLERFAPDFPILDAFIDQIYSGPSHAISLLENRSFLGLDMEIIVRKIIQHQSSPDATKSYTDVLAMELLLLFLMRSQIPMNGKLKTYNRYTEEALYIRDVLKAQAEDNDFDDQYDTEIQLARKVNLSPYQLSTAFKMAFGMPPHQMLMDFRFQKARNLLLDTTLSIFEIALKTGYNTPEAFAKAFHNRCGIAPSKYRKKED